MNLNHEKWYKTSFRRHLIDMHIPDWDDRFMSQFDSEQYVDMLAKAHVDTAMVYTSSCLGICYWPTKLGHMHNGLKGKDIFSEIMDGCHQKGIKVIAYHNFWSKWAYDEHPDWRFVSAKGQGTAEYLWTPGRYGVCCFNSPYREFMLGQIEDLCKNYSFEGLWIDMIHWPYSVCYCSHCRRRYQEEVGGDLPQIINWEDPAWVLFQRKREQWLAEFTEQITSLAKRTQPSISVGHQCASWSVGWQNGLTNDFYKQSDYVSGDFYGDALHQSFICKLLYRLSENKPFEFMTSRSPDLTHHTTLKSEEMIKAQAYSAMLNRGGFLIIDAIDPVGTMDSSVYDTIGSIYSEVQNYEKYIEFDSEPCQDVGIYINFESEIDPADIGKKDMDAELSKPVIEGAMNAAKALIEANIPFGVLTKKNLHELNQFQIIVLPDVWMMDAEEVSALKEYARGGGRIYASHLTSLLDKEGKTTGNFSLSEVFGLTYLGQTDEAVTYMAPSSSAYGSLFTRYTAQSPLTILSKQTLTAPGSNTQVLATLSLPYVSPEDVNRCASAISNPPGITTTYPAVTLHSYGQGECLYSAGRLEGMETHEHRHIFVNLIRLLQQKPFAFESNAPKPVEITLFHEPELGRYMLNLLNFQSELPNIPVEGIQLNVHMNGKIPERVLLLPDETELEFVYTNACVEFKLPRLEMFAMIALHYN